MKPHRRFALLWPLACLAALPAALADTPGEPPHDAAPKSVEEKIDEVDPRVRILERKGEIEQEKAADKTRETATIAAGRDGFVLRSADGDFQLRIRAYVQLDGRFYQREVEVPVSDSFLLRRARPIFEATVYRIFDFRMMADFGEGKSVIQDAYMEARVAPYLKIRAGKYKPPVGLERLQSATDLLFVERALPTNLVPNRDIGIQVAGDVSGGVLSYAAGFFNGVPDGSSADADTNDGKEAAARVFLQPFVKSSIGTLKGLGFGVAASHGENLGTPAATGLPSYKTASEQSFFSYRSDAKTLAATVVGSGRRERLAPQLYWYAWRFGLMGEWVRSSQKVDLDGVGDTLRNEAWQASGSFLLTDDRASYRGVSPKKPIDGKGSGTGAVEVALRYGHLSIDDGTFPVFANIATAVRSATEKAAGVNWYLNRNARVMLDFVRTSFRGGSATGDREDENVFLTRFQLAF